MTAIPSVNIRVLSNGLGNSAGSPANVVAVMGCSSGGAIETPTKYSSNPNTVFTDFGYGPGPELVANLVLSGVTVIFVKTATNVAGSIGSVTFAGSGSSIMTVTGSSYDRYDVQVLCTRAGTAGTDPEPGFKISLDGGQTFSREYRMPAARVVSTLAAQTGFTLNFTAGTMVAGDLYTFSTTAPVWGSGDAVDALEALRTSKLQAALPYLIGPCVASDASTISTELAGFVDRKKFVRLITEARDQNAGETEAAWMTSLENDYASFTDDRFIVAAGYALVTSAQSGTQFRRSIGWPAVLRAALVQFGRSIAAVEDGALVPFSRNGVGPAITTIYHDEALNPGLNDARFMTSRTYNGLQEFDGMAFITLPLIMSSPTSDFSELQYGRVMDEACRVTNAFFTKKLNTNVRLDKKTGFILDKDRRNLEIGNDNALKLALVSTGNVSPVDQMTFVAANDNISTTKIITVTVSILPLGYLETINCTLSFVNPALAAAA